MSMLLSSICNDDIDLQNQSFKISDVNKSVIIRAQNSRILIAGIERNGRIIVYGDNNTISLTKTLSGSFDLEGKHCKLFLSKISDCTVVINGKTNRLCKNRNGVLRHKSQPDGVRIRACVSEDISDMSISQRDAYHRSIKHAIKYSSRDGKILRYRSGISIRTQVVSSSVSSIKDECSICYDDMDRMTDEAAYLDCLHWYHADCLMEWLKKKPKCPKCESISTNLFITMPPINEED